MTQGTFYGFVAAATLALLLGCQPGTDATHVAHHDEHGHEDEGDSHAGHAEGHEDHDHDGHDEHGHDEHGHDEHDDHDGHDHGHEHPAGPASFQDAVVQLRQIQVQLVTAMDENDLDAAHDPLHDVGHLLKQIPPLATDTDLSEQEWNRVKVEVDKLFDAFGDFDAAFHDDGDKQAAYDANKDKIDEAITSLEAKVKLAGGNVADSDSTHAGEDHDHADEHDHDGDAG